jgi:formylglycine-generating enzyme required for sulfatase activity
MAIEHRLMHGETLAYMLHALPYSMKKAPPVRKFVPAGPVTSRQDERSECKPDRAQRSRVDVPAGIATLGMDRNSESFGWDNEFDAHEVHVPSFAIDVHKVTNAQYLEFIHAGGYEERSYWDASSWEWITAVGIRHPKFWKPDNGAWLCRTMFADVEFQSSWPSM